jgi:hypothetical protein
MAPRPRMALRQDDKGADSPPPRGPTISEPFAGAGTGDIPDNNCTATSPLNVVKYPPDHGIHLLPGERIMFGKIICAIFGFCRRPKSTDPKTSAGHETVDR